MRMRLIVVLLFAISATYGCARASLQVLQPVPAPVKDVSLRFNESAGEQLNAEQSGSYRAMLTSHLNDKGVRVVSSGTADAHAAQGTVDEFDPGSRALRYFIGFGAGTGRLRSRWDVTDAAGQVVGACKIDGSISIGVFGGSFDAVLEESAERLGEFLNGEGE